MGSAGAAQWDETSCNAAACQHPSCWASAQRIESGRPRMLLAGRAAPGRGAAGWEDKLPTLKVVDLPLNCPQRGRVKCAESLGSISKTISSSKEARGYVSRSTLNDGWIPAISILSSERNPFPRMESHSHHFSPICFTSLRQPEKSQVTDLAEFAVRSLGYQPTCGNTVVQWVPDMQPEKPDVRVMASPRRICVKNLALESTLSLKDNQEAKRKKSNKVPTGGQPYLLHLRPSQKSSIKSSSAGREGNADGSLTRTRLPCVCSPHPWPQTEGGVNLERGRGGVLLESKEVLAAPFILQKAPYFHRFEATAAGNCKLQTSPGIVAKRKSCMKFMEHKSHMAKLGTEGCSPFLCCTSKAECRYWQHCEYVANREKATLAQSEASEASREPWREEDEDCQEAKKTFVQLRSSDPPPPPPSPLLSESSHSCLLGFT